jgi:hypothetical protein
MDFQYAYGAKSVNRLLEKSSPASAATQVTRNAPTRRRGCLADNIFGARKAGDGQIRTLTRWSFRRTERVLMYHGARQLGAWIYPAGQIALRPMADGTPPPLSAPPSGTAHARVRRGQLGLVSFSGQCVNPAQRRRAPTNHNTETICRFNDCVVEMRLGDARIRPPEYREKPRPHAGRNDCSTFDKSTFSTPTIAASSPCSRFR